MTMPTFKQLTDQRAFMRMWTARLCGTMGSQMLMVALGWQMYELTGSAWDLGLVGLYQFVPALLLTLIAGHLADRLHRGRIIACCYAVQSLVALVLILATQGWGGASPWVSRGLLFGLSVLLGVARAFQMPAQQALTPSLVPPHMLPRALAFSSGGNQAAVIAGPALGGLIFVAGATAVYATCAALFIGAAVLIALLRYQHTAPLREPVTLSSLLAGVDFVWHNKAVLGAVSLDLFAVLLGGATALLPMFAKDILHVGPWGLGLLRAAPAVGALIAAVILTRSPLKRRVGRSMLLAVALYGLCMVVFSLSTSLLLSMAVLAISGSCDMLSVVVRQTLVQLETPDAMRGRVSAVNSVFIGASNQLGEFESGASAALVGPVASVLLGGLGTLLVAALWFKYFPALAKRDRLLNDAAK
ncbi:Enterobactin exporter EntS [Polaromonas vacuolata]|uniref:Enterobactin exporter EntS n=1 Tax=Polaromonas vacuolata TaxID=37448 RepID=A0A6H2HAR7_9BURK|nr:MFS transporter [Polaromonas vacuolata]QJC56955.1 Enterobactin exporter EntS [Polaromonas vacuolata]